MYRLGLLAILLLLIAVPAKAQFGDIAPLSIVLGDQYPGPHETITVSPASTLIDLSASTVTLTANGVAIGSGSGTGGFLVTTGGAGEALTLRMTAVTGGKTYTATRTLRPASVALVVEPVSTTHPFYKGASLLASEGRVRLIAVSDLRSSSGSPLDPAKLVYTWHAGDRLLTDESGIGHATLVLTGPILYRDAAITVMVASQDNSVIAEGAALLSPVPSSLVLYRNDPLLGPVYDRALSGNYAMPETEDGFMAVPYFFSGIPAFAWTVNGAGAGADPAITLRATGSGPGNASVAVSATGANAFESTARSIQVSFTGSEESSGIFNL